MEETENIKPRKKDGWDIAKVVLEPVGGLLTAIAVALLGFYGSRVIEQQQRFDSNFRLYSELMSRREESESALRKDMFKSIIDSFLKPDKENSSLDGQLLHLELLAYNFHESLNLKPLFTHIEKSIQSIKNPTEKAEQVNTAREAVGVPDPPASMDWVLVAMVVLTILAPIAGIPIVQSLVVH